MSLFSKLFSHHDEAEKTILKETIASEINISEAITAHMKWKGRLQNFLNGTSQEILDPQIICRDDQCLLGKWIHGPALHYFHANEGFIKLRSAHAHFHIVAGNVVQNILSNERATAELIINNEYLQASLEVINDLSDLHQAIQE